MRFFVLAPSFMIIMDLACYSDRPETTLSQPAPPGPTELLLALPSTLWVGGGGEEGMAWMHAPQGGAARAMLALGCWSRGARVARS